MKKQFLSLLLAACLIIGMLPANVIAAANAAEAENPLPFTDAQKGDWFYDAVSYVHSHGLFNGTGADTFSPQGTMTRGMYVTVIGRMVGADVEKYKNSQSFQDVTPTDYYAPYVAWAVGLGITNGIGNGLFGPDALVSREQMAAFTARLFSALSISYPDANVSASPKDLNRIAEYAKESVLALYKCGLITGDNFGNFNPENNLTRAECATLIMRIDKHLVKTGFKEYPKEIVEEDKKEENKTTPGTSRSIPANNYTVTFKDGDREIERISAPRNKPLARLPSSDKTAKDGAIFLGWYTDKTLTSPFYKDEPISGNMTVYAKYQDLSSETISPASFALTDQDPDVSFEIVKTQGSVVEPGKAFTLVPKDGSDPLKLTWTVEGDVYTVTAEGGFNKGSSYELTLADGYYFKDKPDSIRTASFTIKMEEVTNLELNDKIVYIRDTDDMVYRIGTSTYDVLKPSLVPKSGGKFEYPGAAGLKVGDIICFYINTNPKDRDYTKDAYIDDPEVYVKVQDIFGTTVTFGALDEDETQKLYNIPDNFPIIVASLPSGDTGTVNINGLDINTYKLIKGNDGTIDNAKASINAGDFVSLYVSAEGVGEESSVYFGKVTNYDPKSGVITFKKSSADAILESMDLYVTPDVSGDDFISDEEKEEIEKQLYKQVKESGFAEDAAFMLVDLAAKTDGFKNLDSVQNVFLKDSEGNPLSDDEIALLDIGKSFELSDEVGITVELITRGDRLRYKGGVQLAIGLDASFEVETEDEGTIIIDLSAAFIEEVAIDIGVKGALVYKEVLGFIPIPIGVNVSTNLDVKNFIAVSFDVDIYTVEAEEEDLWEKLEQKLKDSQIGPLLEKVEELENKIAEAKGTADQLLGYAKDIKNLWGQIEALDGEFTQEEFEFICEELEKTTITQDLMEMLELSTDPSVEVSDYVEKLQDLMQQYSDMLQTETDWVKIVDSEMFSKEFCIAGIAINLGVNFVVRLDLNMAMGSRLEYEVGKRYIVWFKIGLFKPQAGSETMDLLDERFAFQFYVMGKLGAKMGVALSISAGIGSAEIASVGITGEIGPYMKLYGFFIYEYEKMRPKNSSTWEYRERMAGALYFEFGLYFILSFEAEALDLFEYSYDFADDEIPLAHAGEKRYQYSFAYEIEPDEKVRVVDEDADSTTGITMRIPDSLLSLSYVDLNTGILGSESYSPENFSYSFSNPRFSIDENGVISVDVPDGVQYIESDVTITYLHKKLAFSKYDMSVTVPLVWTNLNDRELVEYFTASVRVGNDTDGYQTVWSRRVKKNELFNLPNIDEVKKLINFSNYDYEGVNMKYENISDYGYPSTDITIFKDTVYDINLAYKTYSVTVEGVQNADGSKVTRTYTAKYGEPFDFSDLANTGTDMPGTYTKFATITAQKAPEDIGFGELSTYDLSAPVEGKLALALTQGKVSPVVAYVDDSISVAFEFMGIDHGAVVQKIKRGTEPDIAEIEGIVSEYGMAIGDISPALGKLYTNTTYTVNCVELTGAESTISFDENGGSSVSDITKVVGSLIGTLPTPVKEGYTFEGWYTDSSLTKPFTLTKMPEEDITLYAKWSAVAVTVTLNANGGSFGGDENTKTITVTYAKPYGALPSPSRSGKSFTGWFTGAYGGEKVSSSTVVDKANSHTLYAHWEDLVEIPRDALTFTPVSAVYERDKAVLAEFELSEEYAHFGKDSFSLEYRIQSDPNAEILAPVNAGTYDVVVKREEDGKHGYFEARYSAMVRIEKATRVIDDVEFDVNRAGYTFIDIAPTSGIMDKYDISPDAKFTYVAMRTSGGLVFPNDYSSSKPGSGYIDNLMPDTDYYVKVSVADDPNYYDTTSTNGAVLSTLPAPAGSWLDHTEDLDMEGSVIEIYTPGQLAAIAREVINVNSNFKDKTIMLMNDIDLTGYIWETIENYINNANKLFLGTFDGCGYVIRGLYCDSDYKAGLFGTLSQGARIVNVILDESYIKGYFAGGIVTSITNNGIVENCVNYATVHTTSQSAGGIAGEIYNDGQIKNCVNYGRIISNNYIERIGGIVGTIVANKRRENVVNCVNYGDVTAPNCNSVGGIAGYQRYGLIINCANFGKVTGQTNVGGIVGYNYGSDGWMFNCYTTGIVEGSGQYIGSVVGRNYHDDGKVEYCYYLKGTATCNGASRNGVGTEKGSLNDGEKGHNVANFTSATSALSRNTGAGATCLVDALSAFVDSWISIYKNISEWVEAEDGYPVPSGLPTYSK